MNNTQFSRIILNAFDVKDKLRPELACMKPVHAGDALSEQFSYLHDPGTRSPSDAYGDGPECQAWDVADDARRLGLGTLIAEYLEREEQHLHDQWHIPIQTEFGVIAEAALNALVENCADAQNARATPELHDAYVYLAGELNRLSTVLLRYKQSAIGQYRNPNPSLAEEAARWGIVVPEPATV